MKLGKVVELTTAEVEVSRIESVLEAITGYRPSKPIKAFMLEGQGDKIKVFVRNEDAVLQGLPKWNPEGFWRRGSKGNMILVGRRRAKLMRRQYGEDPQGSGREGTEVPSSDEQGA